MDCRSGRVDEGRILIPVMVAPPGGGATAQVGGLADTGADISGITPALAERLKIKPVDSILTVSTDGWAEKDAYYVDIYIPPQKPASGAKKKSAAKFRRLYVVEFYDDEDGVDVIIGMDLITQGYLEINKDAFTFCL